MKKHNILWLMLQLIAYLVSEILVSPISNINSSKKNLTDFFNPLDSNFIN